MRERLTIIDPVRHAQAVAYHAGIERAKMQRPMLPALAVERELETLEVELVMQEAPAYAAAT